jgi:hypothetical protein
MSHRILKPNMTEPKGLLTDLSDIAESYYYWAMNEFSGSWLDFKRSKGWSIQSSETWVVHHAIDEDDNDEKIPKTPYSRV